MILEVLLLLALNVFGVFLCAMVLFMVLALAAGQGTRKRELPPCTCDDDQDGPDTLQGPWER